MVSPDRQDKERAYAEGCKSPLGQDVLIGRRFYTSAVICTADAEMLRVRGGDLQKLCEQDPETGVLVLERLADVIAERLRHTHPQVLSLLENSIRNGVKC